MPTSARTPCAPTPPQAPGAFGSSTCPVPSQAPADEDNPVVEDGQRHDADPPVVPISRGVQGPAPGGGGAAGGGRGTSGLPHPRLAASPHPAMLAPGPPPALHRGPAPGSSSTQPAPRHGIGCSTPADPVALRGVPATCSHSGPHGGQPCPAHPQACPVLVPGLAVAMSAVVLRGWGQTQRWDSTELSLCILHCGRR